METNAFDWDDIDLDIDYLRDTFEIPVPDCETCSHNLECDGVISDCLDHGVIELRVIIAKQ